MLTTLPAGLLALLLCGGAAALTTLAQFLVHRFWHVDSRKSFNELTGFVIAVVGVVYGVLLASVAVVAMERYQKAEEVVQAEARLVADIYLNASGLPEPLRGQIRASLADYLQTVIDDEWEPMARAESLRSDWSVPGWLKLAGAFQHLAAFEPVTARDQIFVAQTLSRFDDLFDARGSRMFILDGGIKPVIWWVMAMGAIATIGLALAFGVHNTGGHLLVSNTLAVSIALVFLLIVSMDSPFSGSTRVMPEVLERAQQRLIGAPRPAPQSISLPFSRNG
jgi:amino acid transporter